MKSTVSNASLNRGPSGADSTGLPAMVMTARTCPSPGVSISSASATAGISESTSGWPDTLLRQRPVANPRPGRGGRGAEPIGGLANMTPPARSRLPVRMLTTSTSQLVRVPNSTVEVPMRPYTAALGAAAISRASVRMSSAGIPQCAATASGGKSAAAARTCSTPVTWSARRPSSTRSSSNSTLTTANSSAASVPGRTAR
jgi:hypothetical protein